MSKIRIIGIYKITNLINGKVYVGQSVDIKARQNGHAPKYEQNRHLRDAYKRYGIESFSCEILKEVSQEEYVEGLNKGIDLLTQWESFYMEEYDSRNPEKGYNFKEAGPKGRASEETRQRMREAQKGKVVSEETCRKLKEAHKRNPRPGPMKGKHHTESTRQKISELKKGNKYRKGSTHTEESIQKMRKSHENSPQPAWNKGLIGVQVVSEKTRQKHSEISKRLGLKPPKRFSPHSPESIQKMRDAKKGCTGRIKTEEEKRKISETMKRVRAEQKEANK